MIFERARFHAFLLCAVMCASSCAPEAEEGNETFSDETLVSLVIDNWVANVNKGRSDLALDYVRDDFLLQGRDKEAMRQWVGELQAQGGLKLELYHVEINVDGDSAVVDYELQTSSCPSGPGDQGVDGEADGGLTQDPCTRHTACHAKNLGACGWLRHLTRDESGWKLTGDRSPFGFQVFLRADQDGISIVGTVYDPDGRLVSGEVTWKGGGVSVALEKSTASLWTLADGAPIPDGVYSGQPMPWHLTVELETASGPERHEIEVVSVMDHFATDLQPSGEAAQPFQFSWLGLDTVPGGAEVHLFSDDKILWRSRRVFEQPLEYAGPSLEPGRSYPYQVVFYDLYGNHSVASTTLIPIDVTDVSPRPMSIAPSSGPATGGTELIITGADFLPMARVNLGTAQCLQTEVVSSAEIHCVSPALEPGVYNVVVINPSGKTGILEKAFTAYDVPAGLLD